jgi:hypothetical protein
MFAKTTDHTYKAGHTNVKYPAQCSTSLAGKQGYNENWARFLTIGSLKKAQRRLGSTSIRLLRHQSGPFPYIKHH